MAILVSVNSLLYLSLALCFTNHPIHLEDAVYFFLTSLLYSYSYFHIFNMANTARRIQILILQYQRECGLVIEEKPYNGKFMIEQRLERLLATDVIEERENQLYIRQGLMLCAAKILSRMRALFY